MPGLLQRGHKRPSTAISDDENEDDQPEYSSVSVGSKRARHPRDASDSPGLSHGRVHNHLPTQNGIGVEDVFQPGSLIRVKLRNFVTYTAAEFHLGPSLNMVIGPNGTGKSTLVCAICLGLGWGSEHLGRAKELGQFVKHGATEAEIEIELAAGPGMERNPIVQRIIRKEDNKSQFLLNGKRVAQNAVTTMAKGFSIQIDNLCQFLPQDRVVEFAKMTDVDRLRETQRAAAPPHMVEWHDQLKVLRTEEKTLQTKGRNEQDHLEKLERQQNAARDDVERWHQREDLLQKSKCLKKVKPIIEIRLRKNDLTQAKLELRTAKRELDQINSDVEPVRMAQAEVETYCNQIEDVVKLRQNRVDMIKKQAETTFAKLEKDKKSISDLEDEVTAEANSKKARDRDIVRIKADIANLERRQQDEPPQYDANEFDQRKAELRAQHSSVSNRLMQAESTHQDLRSRGQGLTHQHREIAATRARLDTQGGKQESILQQTSPDTRAAWKWFQENKDSLPLQGQVFGPPILTCSIPDSAYAQAVESQLKKGDLLAITCTNSADWKFLSNKFFKTRANDGLQLHDVYLRNSSKPFSSYQSPVAKAQLEHLGFQGYIIDYIRGPDDVLAMLCDNSRLHRTAFAPDSMTDEQHELVTRSPIQTWVSGSDVYKITTRREYSQSSTSVMQLKPAKFFVEQAVNIDEKRELDEKIENIRREVMELQEQLKITKQEMIDLQAEKDEARRQKDEVQAEQNRIQKMVAEWAALPGKIAQKQTELDSYVDKNAQTSDRIRAIKAKSRDVSLNIAALTLDYAKAVTQMRIFYESLVEAEIRLIEAKSELSALKTENNDILQNQKRKMDEIEQLDQRNRTMRLEYEQMVKVTQQDLGRLTPEEKELMKQYRDLPSLEALEQEVLDVQARLGMMAEGNPGAIKAYEKREEEINKTRERLGQHSDLLEEAKQKIADIREQWEPQLDALMSRISDAFAYNFQQIGCAGEVVVYKDPDDFDHWSVQISVRFREGETLSVLNSHRQSGGERAVSTIFYLMALQDLAQSPFRVVDEINQGMDPRNERMVHERMVDIACQERTSQYFLVTPKLLSGLKFHPKMKVHIINSGEHVPEAKSVQGGWDLKNIAKLALRSRKGIEFP